MSELIYIHGDLLLEDWTSNPESNESYGWAGLCEMHRQLLTFDAGVDEGCGSGLCSVFHCDRGADHYLDFDKEDVKEVDLTTRTTKDGVSYTPGLLTPKYYLDNGCGCGTVYYKTLNQARRARNKYGTITGGDFDMCTKCQGHYSVSDPEHNSYPQWACKPLKERYALSLELPPLVELKVAYKDLQ